MAIGNASIREFFPVALASVRSAWATELEDRTFRLKLVLVPGLFIAYSAATQRIANYVELRRGLKLEDKLLHYVPVANYSVFIFLLLYCSLITVVAAHLTRPRVIVRVLEMHLAVAVIRQLCILLVPLEPPAGILLLKDVFLENTVYPHHTAMTKDLFFSGHVASMWIYFLCAEHRYLKTYFGCGAALMGFMVLSMRVHYSYDVYGAIFFTSIIYSVIAYLRKPKHDTGGEVEPVRVPI